MKEISRDKRLEVAQYYLLGHTYKEIEAQTGVSHGSITNIVQELENGKLEIPGTPFDQVNDLRHVSLDLKKKGLSTSQAVLGLLIFEKVHDLDIVPEQFDQCSQLITKFNQPDFPAGDFLRAALKLCQLEKSEGKTFEIVTEEYEKAKEKLGKLNVETGSLEEKRVILSQEVASTSAQLQQLENAKFKLDTQVNALADEVKGLQSIVEGSKSVRTALNEEIQELQQKKVKLSSQVDGKEESLARLNVIGFQEEDILKIEAILDWISQETSASQKEVKRRFFQLLSTYKAITELEASQGAHMVDLEDLIDQKSVLTGEIAALENKKSILQGEIGQSASSVIGEIKAVGENAVSELKQQADDIRAEINTLFAEALRLTVIVNEIKAAAKKGEESEKSLSNFVEDIKGRMGTY
jgi:predicted  nucleic acid-binding Zn-ribbon protein